MIGSMRVHFPGGTHEDMAEDTPAESSQPSADPSPGTDRTLLFVRLFRPNAARVWVWRAGQWCEGMFETYQQQIDRLTKACAAESARADAMAQERIDALRVAAAWEKDYEAECARADSAEATSAEWQETSAEWQRKYDAAWMQRDDARRIAVLDRTTMTQDEYAEFRALVDHAKREGWL